MSDQAPSLASALANCRLLGFVSDAVSPPGRGSVSKAGSSKSGSGKLGIVKGGGTPPDQRGAAID